MEPTPHSDGVWAEGADQSGRDPRCGRFQLGERFDTDQVPLSFVKGQSSTWEPRGNKRVHVAQPFPDLEKRQCTVQPTIGAGGKTIRCAIISVDRASGSRCLKGRRTPNASMCTSSRVHGQTAPSARSGQSSLTARV